MSRILQYLYFLSSFFSSFSTNQEVVDNLADDFIVTETAEAVEVAIAKSASKPVRDRLFLICK